MSDRACRECRELISAFIDGDATHEENARLRQHLATCADCRATLDAYRGIGNSIRTLQPVLAPQHLTEAIYARTIDAEPRRLFLITSRLGYSLAAVASILLIFVVAAYLIIGGYQRSVDPVVDSSAPKMNDVWKLQDAIRITFNKDMNRESVIAALGMQPSGEKDRLAHHWDGNTLVLGGNTTLKPGASYEIKISTDATDKWGNALKEPFELKFTTQTTLAMLQTPTPTPQPTPTAPPASETPTKSIQTAVPTAESTPVPDDPAPAVPTATADIDPAPGNGDGTTIAPGEPVDPVVPTATSTAPRPTPTPTPVPVEPTDVAEPTMTPTPSSTATATAVPATQTPTLVPTATATTPAPPTATPTPDAIPVTDAIGDVYWRDESVQDRLGEPTAAATNFATEQLEFQRGVMLLNESGNSIYVLMFGSGWDLLSAPSGDYPQSEPGPEQGIYEPGGVFGALWNREPSVADNVGYALSQTASKFSVSAQTFEGGLMLATPATVYVIYYDGFWDWFTHSGS